MNSDKKYNVLTDLLFEYLTQQRTGTDNNIFDEIRAATSQFGDDAIMQIPDHQGTFLTILAKLIGAKSALEIGTFTGASSICIARGLQDGGRLICMDMSQKWTDVARTFWKQDGLEDKIELQVGDALDSLNRLDPKIVFDIIHIDAEKLLYDEFFEASLPRLRSGGVIVFDNMLRGGRVVSDSPDDGTISIIRLNKKLARDPRVETVLVEIGDGLQICRKV